MRGEKSPILFVVLLTVLFTAACAGTSSNNNGNGAQTYSISGQISVGNSGLAGVSVALSGPTTAIVTTDGSGNYTFSGLSDGSYTVTPALTGYTFTPTNLAATVSGSDVTGENFTAVATVAPLTYSISGQITFGGSGLTGVAVALSGSSAATTTTDVSGNYTFSGLSNGSYTVTPAMAGYTFTPTNLAATVSGADVTGKNFTAATTGGMTTHAISGTISGALYSGVTMQLSGAVIASSVTDTHGNYSFTGLFDGAYTITPSALDGTFLPASRSVQLSGADANGINFNSTMAGLTLFNVGGQPEQIVAGVDGNLWYTDSTQNAIIKMTPGGVSTAYPVPTAASYVWGLAAMPHGLAFTELVGNKVGVLGYNGLYNGEWAVPTANFRAYGITYAPDGALYFVESYQGGVPGTMDRIGQITGWGTAAFSIKDYSLSVGGRTPMCIASSPYDSRLLWFTESAFGQVGVFRNSLYAGGAQAGPTYNLPAIINSTNGIVAGPNSSMWFTESDGNAIGEITMSGTITEYAIPTPNSHPLGIAVDSGGTVWYAGSTSGKIGKSTSAGTISETSVGVSPSWIAIGSDGNIWFTSQAPGRIGRLVPW